MTNKHNLITEVKEAIKKASIDYPWDTNGTFIEWENGHPLKGTHRTIAYTDASWSGGVQFENPNHAADAHLICNAPTWLQKLVTELEEAHKEINRLSLLFEEITKFRGNGKSVNWCYGQSLEIANKALQKEGL